MMKQPHTEPNRQLPAIHKSSKYGFAGRVRSLVVAPAAHGHVHRAVIQAPAMSLAR